MASTCLILALAVFSGWFYLQQRAKAQSRPSFLTSTPTPGLEEANMAKAYWLRNKWEVWARAHQTQLRAMLRSKGEDKATFLNVWDTLPIHPTTEEVGFTSYDLVPKGYRPDQKVDSESHPIAVFSWAPISKIRVKPQDSKETHGIQRGIEETKQKDFAELHDISLTDAVRGNLMLWVSGRITKVEYIKNPDHSKGQPIRIGYKHVEVQPPYEFLTQE